MKDLEGTKLITKNRQAYHEYFVLETFEAGISLFGTEIKSIRNGGVNLKDAWKTYTKHITELSQNMRTELMTLRVEDRANKDLQKEKLIRHISTENEYDDMENETSEISTVKKVKKVIK